MTWKLWLWARIVSIALVFSLDRASLSLEGRSLSPQVALTATIQSPRDVRESSAVISRVVECVAETRGWP